MCKNWILLIIIHNPKLMLAVSKITILVVLDFFGSLV